MLWPPLANAALPGLGYALLRRWVASAGGLAATAVLLLILASAEPPAWGWRAVTGLWWTIAIAHAGLLSSRPQPSTPAPRRLTHPRTVAVAAMSALLVLVATLAIDARRITAAAADAHGRGDCAHSLSILDRLDGRHRLVDPFVFRRAERERAACAKLREALAAADDHPSAAAIKLAEYTNHDTARWPGATGLRARLLLTAAEESLGGTKTGSVRATETVVESLAAVLAEKPQHSGEVRRIATAYVDAVSSAAPCHARRHLDWLHGRRFARPELDGPLAALDGKAPPILLACGEELLGRDPEGAREVFEALLFRYPGHDLAGAAAQGVEGAAVRLLLDGWPERKDPWRPDPPRYCDEPAAYRGAPAHTGRTARRVAVFGELSVAEALPASWRASSLDDAALVLCVDGPGFGRRVGACRYPASRQVRATAAGTVAGERPVTVRLHAATYRLRAFALRTGLLVGKTAVEVEGACPLYLHHYRYDPDPFTATTDRVWAEDPAALRQAVLQVVRPLAGR